MMSLSQISCVYCVWDEHLFHKSPTTTTATTTPTAAAAPATTASCPGYDKSE